VEINDVCVMAVARHASEEWLNRGRRHFDRLYKDSEKNARVMAISVHPFLSGVPHRIGYVEELFKYVSDKPDVLFWTGEQILDWYREAKPEK